MGGGGGWRLAVLKVSHIRFQVPFISVQTHIMFIVTDKELGHTKQESPDSETKELVVDYDASYGCRCISYKSRTQKWIFGTHFPFFFLDK